MRGLMVGNSKLVIFIIESRSGYVFIKTLSMTNLARPPYSNSPDLPRRTFNYNTF